MKTSTPLLLQPRVEEMTLEQSLVASKAWPPWQHGFKAGMNISYSGSRALQVHVQRCCENNLKKQQNNGVALGAPIPHRESAPADHSYRGL
ncbi:hypothetical protein Anapl_08049 [Anas platyrhynchos]|uniref:Uncharacterized protein n=1 Tax=Anas platyrhynchos TaxID=8839 RepID=R0M8M2_ANAPL|nr:hypothetical protein Anapl_08049 [Anas platyrhynchos]